MKRIGVIMAGGIGTRFWPMSRSNTPKQLLRITGNDVMINETIDRLANIVDIKDIFIVTNESQYTLMKAVTAGKIPQDNILCEPVGKNTTACIGYATMWIKKRYGEGVMVIVPSDSYVKDKLEYKCVVEKAIMAAESQEKVVTIGIIPKFPATGYGYIKFDINQKGDVKNVLKFIEKPDIQTAKNLCTEKSCVWNSGMYICQTSTLIHKLEQFVPKEYSQLRKIGQDLNTAQEQNTIKEIYSNIRNVSIDYSVIQPAAEQGDVLVVLGNFGWNDMGNWDSIREFYDPDASGNITLGDTVTINTKNSVLYSTGKLVATVGVENLIIIQTEDAILVCHNDATQDVKLVVDKLNMSKRVDVL